MWPALQSATDMHAVQRNNFDRLCCGNDDIVSDATGFGRIMFVIHTA